MLVPVRIRKLTGDDAARYFPARHQQDVAEYVDALRGLGAGDVAEVQVGDVGEHAMKRRLTTAAKQLGMTLQWAKKADRPGVIGFRVKEAKPASAPKRRGRPPQTSSA